MQLSLELYGAQIVFTVGYGRSKYLWYP